MPISTCCFHFVINIIIHKELLSQSLKNEFNIEIPNTTLKIKINHLILKLLYKSTKAFNLAALNLKRSLSIKPYIFE